MNEPCAMATLSASAVYEGVVRHRRHAPHAHAFAYRIAQLYLDLDDVEHVFDGRLLWSTRRRNIAEFRRSDYLAPNNLPLSEAVRRCVENATHHRPSGPIRLLTHLRYAGVIFNPVNFYYCYDTDGITLDTIVAEITNTPWKERYAYVLPVRLARSNGPTFTWDFAKAFHVSPFMAMNRDYAWRFTAPDDRLIVHMDVLRDGEREFDASLAMRRRPLSGRSLARVLVRYPWMTMQVIGAIYWQALRLWTKRTPVYNHPDIRA